MRIIHYIFAIILLICFSDGQGTFTIISTRDLSPASFGAPKKKANFTFEVTAIQNLNLQTPTQLIFMGNRKIFQNLDMEQRSAVTVNGTTIFTYTRAVTLSNALAVFNLVWDIRQGSTVYGNITKTFEITCDDGIFCNGIEVWSNNNCVTLPRHPCDDGQACTTDECIEETGRCNYYPSPACNLQCGIVSCEPYCDERECGDNGCGGECGFCSPTQACSTNFKCIDRNATRGTCYHPLPLFPNGQISVGTYNDTRNSFNFIDSASLTCGGDSTAPDVVYTFTIPPNKRYSMDFRVFGFDTLMELSRDGCEMNVIECNDQSYAGEDGSRIVQMLGPGTYYLVVTGFNQGAGIFHLTTIVGTTCVRRCEHYQCGADGCGGTCGTCQGGTVCQTYNLCYYPCQPSCYQRECGPDGCGGSCGTCPGANNYCRVDTGKCETFPACNHFFPVCSGCTSTQYCGTDCQCYNRSDLLPDIIVDEEMLANSISFETRFFDNTSCSVYENCIGGLGYRRLLKFGVGVTNQGLGNIKEPGPPATRPDLYEYSYCHNHFHFKHFSKYELFDVNGNYLLSGHKQSFCMINMNRVLNSPAFSCTAPADCNNQQINAGWQDVYMVGLDCQWIDITGLAPGDYLLRIELNTGRVIQEASLNNNAATVPVTIPPE